MTFTVKQLQEKLKLAYADAYSLVRGLEALDLVKVVGKLPSPSGKGKPSAIYESVTDLAEQLTAKFSQ